MTTTRTVRGIFRGGIIELAEVPPGLVDGTAVTVEIPVNGGVVGRMGRDVEREESRRRAFAEMEAGLDLGGPPYPTREELHERHGR